MTPIFTRHVITQLNQWLAGRDRKPLILRGARQVGKSTLVRELAVQNKLFLNEINLEKERTFDEIFKTLSISKIVQELNSFFERDIKVPGSLLFLDEIQATPHAIQALRYFYEELPGLQVIAAGSLLEFALKKANFTMPVGRVEYLYIGPMTFEEYLCACSEEHMLAELQKVTPTSKPTQVLHTKLLERQREFLFVGGMPAVVKAYIQTTQFTEVIRTQRSIIETYQDDFSKYATGQDLVRLTKIFNQIPRTIGQKTKYVNLSTEDNSREIKRVLELLSKAGVMLPVYHSDCSGVPLLAGANHDIFKMLFLDIGMANRVLGLDWRSIASIPERELVNEGALAEQFVGQHLLHINADLTGPGLFYWLREGKSGNAEVDYVVSRAALIVPVEVKAGKSGSLRSLQQFVMNKKVKLAIRFDTNVPSVQKIRLKQGGEFTLISLPLYCAGQLRRIIDWYSATDSSFE